VFLNPLGAQAEFDRQSAEIVARSWWIGVVAGLIAIVFGILILTIDWGVQSLAWFLGALLVIQGLTWVAEPPLDGSPRNWTIALGLLEIAAGIAIIVWPDIGLVTLAVFIGAALVARGLLHVVGALVNRHLPHWWLILVLGLVEVPIGIWCLRRPGLTLVLLITLTGIWSIVTGIWEIVVALELRNLPRRLRAAV
jgi:uncharacterized membrane protein HdeD (DUF308 family)